MWDVFDVCISPSHGKGVVALVETESFDVVYRGVVGYPYVTLVDVWPTGEIFVII